MDTGLLSLFFGSFLASTIIPGGVEGLLYWLVKTREYSFAELLVTATLGNTLGGITTFYMGGLLRRGVTRLAENSNRQEALDPPWPSRVVRLFQLKESSVERVRKWGVPVLFFSWLPVVGDPLCIAAGYLKLPVWSSITFIAVGKFCRYLVLLWVIL
ncbi:MAG: DedA family protein [Gammaproteobacteria bacterium]|nr:DedA family protein [Gammaproteobacteria bacterium]